MSEWHPIIAGPSFEGIEEGIWICLAVFSIWAAAAVYATYRPCTAGDDERLGLLFWCALAIAFGGMVYVGVVFLRH